MGRTASGVKGISLDNEGDEVIGMICIESGKSDVLVVLKMDMGNVLVSRIIVSRIEVVRELRPSI